MCASKPFSTKFIQLITPPANSRVSPQHTGNLRCYIAIFGGNMKKYIIIFKTREMPITSPAHLNIQLLNALCNTSLLPSRDMGKVYDPQ